MKLLSSHFVPVLQWKALEFRTLYEETLLSQSEADLHMKLQSNFKV